MNVNVNKTDRKASLVGVLAFAAWGIIVSYLLNAIFFHESAETVYSDPLMVWVIFGPLLAFVYLGNVLLSGKVNEAERRVYARAVAVCLAAFFLWAIGLLTLSAIEIDVPFVANVIIGYAIALASVMAYSKWAK